MDHGPIEDRRQSTDRTCPFADASFTPRGAAIVESTPSGDRLSHPLMVESSSVGKVARMVIDLFQKGINWLNPTAQSGERLIPALWYSPQAAMQLLLFTKDPRSVFHWVHENYGSLAEMIAPNGQKFLFVSDTEVIEHVLKVTDGGRLDHFDKSELLSDGLQSFSPDTRDTILTASDEAWKSRHKAMQASFSRTNFEAPDMAVEISTIVTQSLDELASRCGTDGLRIDLQHEMSLIALRVAMTSLFGISDIRRTELEQVRDAFRTIFAAFPLEALTPGSFPFTTLGAISPASAEVTRSVAFLHDYADQLLEKVRSQPYDSSNPIHLLMKATAAGTTGPLSQTTIRGELLTLMFASHETSGNLLAWTLGKISGEPDIIGKLVEEALHAEHLSSSGLSAKKDTLPYTHQVIQEGLRMFPPLYALLRRASADSAVEISSGNFTIEADTEVILNLFDAQRDESRWGVSRTGYPACDFVPERWSEKNQQHAGINLPKVFSFGGGPRVCIGAHLAMTEFLTILPEFLKRFEYQALFSAVEDGMTSDGTLQRAGGFPAILHQRHATTAA